MARQLKGLRLIVNGVVQGVGFRWFVERTAKKYGLSGWVKNLYDGSVETYAEGDDSLLREFINDVKIGPAGSRVSGVKVEWSEFTGNFKDFRITF